MIHPGVLTILLVLTRPTILALLSLLLSWSLSLSWLEDDSGGELVDDVGDEVLGGSDEKPLSVRVVFRFRLSLFSACLFEPIRTIKILIIIKILNNLKRCH